MIYTLSDKDANKVVNLKDVKVVVVPEESVSGTVFMVFNNSDEFATIQRNKNTTYLSSNKMKKTHIEFPPHCLANILFLDEKTVVVSRGF
jgi:hypothetical protein